MNDQNTKLADDMAKRVIARVDEALKEADADIQLLGGDPHDLLRMRAHLYHHVLMLAASHLGALTASAPKDVKAFDAAAEALVADTKAMLATIRAALLDPSMEALNAAFARNDPAAAMAIIAEAKARRRARNGQTVNG